MLWTWDATAEQGSQLDEGRLCSQPEHFMSQQNWALSPAGRQDQAGRMAYSSWAVTRYVTAMRVGGMVFCLLQKGLLTF